MAGQPGRVMIVGAGPAGMALAYLLARRGVGVTVLEAHYDFARAFRGEGLQHSGIDAFRQMGLGDCFDRVPHTEVRTIEMYSGGRLVVRTDAAGLGRGQARLVSQPALLEMLADEAGRYPSFRLDRGVTVRDLLREDSRVVGVRADGGPREYRADLVVGADGRHAATRKHSGLPELSAPQGYDILWLKVPYPDSYPDRTTGVFEMAASRAAVAFPTADGRLQVGFVIPKGGYAALRARGADAWTEELIGRLPAYLADHLRAHREAVAGATLLNVVCGRLTEWTTPGLLLIGDAAHPMSPVGGQGVNIALRDALVAANHLCPVLTAGGDPSALDAAARRVRDERWPEIVAVQQMQEHQARVLFAPDRWSTRLGEPAAAVAGPHRPAAVAEPQGVPADVGGRRAGAAGGLRRVAVAFSPLPRSVVSAPPHFGRPASLAFRNSVASSSVTKRRRTAFPARSGKRTAEPPPDSGSFSGSTSSNPWR